MKVCSISSGSKGNCIFIESEHARVLVDVGISAKQAREGLGSIDVDASSIDALVLTHAHSDHVRGVGVFSRQFHTPIWGHPETLDSISYLLKKQEPVSPWSTSFKIKDLLFTPFKVSHDAEPTVGYLIENNMRKVVICTDLGVVNQTVMDHVKQADVLILESNHDPEMLMNGPYPWELKERIASRIGHLSNHDSGTLVKKTINGKMQKILLAHLSEENNTEEVARSTMLSYVGHQMSDLIDVLRQRTVSPVYLIK